MSEIHILLVDDDEINRLVATTYLKKSNVLVTVATNGREALDQIQSKKFNIVMMDLHMPEMDGYECTSKIRAMDDPYFKHVPIIVFSASYVIDSKRKAAEFGMTDFMNKPFRADELQEKIKAYAHIWEHAATASSLGLRPLKIDFDLHTDGDPVFKIELAQLMIENVNELRESLREAMKGFQTEHFLKTCHKVYTAVTMLQDLEFMTITDKVRETMRKPIDPNNKELQRDADRLMVVCDEIARSLEYELGVMKKNSPLQQ